MRALKTQAGHSSFYFRAAHEQVPEQAAPVVFYHQDDGSLVNGQVGICKPGILQAEGIIKSILTP